MAPVPLKTVHAEAFQLMLYRNEQNTKFLWVWNSRDGVTPFGMAVDGERYTHAMRSYAALHTTRLPDRASHVWVDYTPETWRKAMTAQWERFKALPSGDAFLSRFPTADDYVAVCAMNPGEPRLVTRAEFMAGADSAKPVLTVGVVCDEYKRPVFREHLKGWTYTETVDKKLGIVTFKVECPREKMGELERLVRLANANAKARTK